MTTIYYALGGGLGHLTRARAMIEHLGIEDAIIVTESPFATDERVVGRCRTATSSEHLVADRLIVDTFPAGLFGELGGLRIDYVARYLRWEKYLESVGKIETQIETTYVMEPLDAAHERFIRSAAVSAAGPPPSRRPARRRRTSRRGRRRSALVVHSGPAEEIEELLEYAREVCRIEQVDAPLLLCAPKNFHRRDVQCVDEYPATKLAENAARIFTAGGFNAMHEFGGDPRHRPLPFERKFDDQFRRVARFATPPASSAAGA